MNEAFADANESVKKMVQDALSYQLRPGTPRILLHHQCHLQICTDLTDPQRQTARSPPADSQ